MPSPLEATGLWDADAASLTVNLTSSMPAGRLVSFSLTLHNPMHGQDAVQAQVGAAGLIGYYDMAGGGGNEAALLVADFVRREISQVE